MIKSPSSPAEKKPPSHMSEYTDIDLDALKVNPETRFFKCDQDQSWLCWLTDKSGSTTYASLYVPY